MTRLPGTAALLLVLGLVLAPTAPLAQGGDAPPKISVAEDLFAVITLRGKPCERVASFSKQAENDYLVTCSDGHRYRVYVANERVVVEER